MTQFKDKSAKHADNINAGLFTYPVLMAADILLYQTDLVPIGADQKQHLEITRDIAQRFNGIYGDVFTIPDAYIGKVGSRVMSLQEPTRKNEQIRSRGHLISLLDKPEDVRRKIKRAVTDSDAEIRFDPENKPASATCFHHRRAFGRNDGLVVSGLSGKGYGELKARATECVIDTLSPFQAEYARIMADKAALQAFSTATRRKPRAAPTGRWTSKAQGRLRAARQGLTAVRPYQT